MTPRAPRSAPRGLQEGSKRAQDDPKDAQRPLQIAGALFRPSWGPFGILAGSFADGLG